jgi:uncharacterized membrane protein YqhA
MYSGLVHLHNVLRWVILLLLIIALLRHLAGMSNKRPINDRDRSIDLFLMIAAHITLVLGIYQWFAGSWGINIFRTYSMKEIMDNTALRFWAVEHISGMVIAIILITIGRGAVKRSIDWTTHKKAFWFFLIALLIILASVPWPFREGIGRPWFPGVQ